MAAAGGAGGGPPPAPAPAPAPACAACKYQRRRCAADCPLAQYFPHDRPSVFISAHRLFGVKNILKTLEHAGPDPERRHEAMQCIVYESQAWDLYPSAGCVPIILALQRRIQQMEHQLRRVRADLQAYRRRAPDAANVMSPSSSSPPAPPPPFQLQWAAMGEGDDDEGIAAAAPLFMYGGGDEQQQQMMAMMINNAAVVTSNDGNMAPPQHEHPFFVNATTMAPDHQFHFKQQPIAVSTSKLPPELQDDTMNYFAHDGMDGENDETMMPRESSTDSSGDRKGSGGNATRNAPEMKDNNNADFMKQDVN